MNTRLHRGYLVTQCNCFPRRETALLSVPREKWDDVSCGELEPLLAGRGGSLEPAEFFGTFRIFLHPKTGRTMLRMRTQNAQSVPQSVYVRFSRSGFAVVQHEHLALWRGFHAWPREPAQQRSVADLFAEDPSRGGSRDFRSSQGAPKTRMNSCFLRLFWEMQHDA